jgi:hypothetical protein
MSRSSAEERRDQHERPWTDANVPDQGGKIFIVTGANKLTLVRCAALEA